MTATRRTLTLLPRTVHADKVVRSVCPYCAVGCGQLVYVPGERISNIEGDPDSPISGACGRRAPGLGGTLALRFAVHEASVASARDPQASFAQQRRGTVA